MNTKIGLFIHFMLGYVKQKRDKKEIVNAYSATKSRKKTRKGTAPILLFSWSAHHN